MIKDEYPEGEVATTQDIENFKKEIIFLGNTIGLPKKIIMDYFNHKEYNIILADPPWKYKDKALAGKRGAECKYPVLTIEEIKQLNIQSIAADDCVFFLWVTFPMLQEGLDTIKAWGFTYKTIGFNWVKRNINKNSWFWGMGNWTRSNAEACLLATKGKPKRQKKNVHSIIYSKFERHSKKPDIVRNAIVDLCGDLPRIELFARERIEGWDAIGNEIDKKDIREVLK